MEREAEDAREEKELDEGAPEEYATDERAVEDEYSFVGAAPDEIKTDFSLEDGRELLVGFSSDELASTEESPQFQTNPAAITVTAKTPEECLYIGTSIEPKTITRT